MQSRQRGLNESPFQPQAAQPYQPPAAGAGASPPQSWLPVGPAPPPPHPPPFAQQQQHQQQHQQGSVSVVEPEDGAVPNSAGTSNSTAGPHASGGGGGSPYLRPRRLASPGTGTGRRASSANIASSFRPSLSPQRQSQEQAYAAAASSALGRSPSSMSFSELPDPFKPLRSSSTAGNSSSDSTHDPSQPGGGVGPFTRAASGGTAGAEAVSGGRRRSPSSPPPPLPEIPPRLMELFHKRMNGQGAPQVEGAPGGGGPFSSPLSAAWHPVVPPQQAAGLSPLPLDQAFLSGRYSATHDSPQPPASPLPQKRPVGATSGGLGSRRGAWHHRQQTQQEAASSSSSPESPQPPNSGRRSSGRGEEGTSTPPPPVRQRSNIDSRPRRGSLMERRLSSGSGSVGIPGSPDRRFSLAGAGSPADKDSPLEDPDSPSVFGFNGLQQQQNSRRHSQAGSVLGLPLDSSDEEGDGHMPGETGADSPTSTYSSVYDARSPQELALTDRPAKVRLQPQLSSHLGTSVEESQKRKLRSCFPAWHDMSRSQRTRFVLFLSLGIVHFVVFWFVAVLVLKEADLFLSDETSLNSLSVSGKVSALSLDLDSDLLAGGMTVRNNELGSQVILASDATSRVLFTGSAGNVAAEQAFSFVSTGGGTDLVVRRGSVSVIEMSPVELSFARRQLLQSGVNGTQLDVRLKMTSPTYILGEPLYTDAITLGRPKSSGKHGGTLTLHGQDGDDSQNVGSDGGNVVLRAGDAGRPPNRLSGAGGSVTIQAGSAGTGTRLGGDIFLESGVGGSGDLTRHGRVIARGRAFEIRPPPATAGGSSWSQINLALDSTGQQMFSIRADPSELSFINQLGEKIFAFPAVGDFTFKNSVSFGNEIKADANDNDAVVTAVTSAAGKVAAVRLTSGSHQASLTASETDLELQTNDLPVTINAGGGTKDVTLAGSRVILSGGAPLVSGTGSSLALQSSTQQILLGAAMESISLERPPRTTPGSGFSTTINGQDATDTGAGGNLVLDAGTGTTNNGGILIGTSHPSEITLGHSGGTVVVEGSSSFSGSAAFSDNLSVAGNLNIAGNLRLASSQIFDTGSNLIIGEAAVASVTVRRPDSGSSVRRDLVIRAGAGTPALGHITVGDLTLNGEAQLLSSSQTVVDSASAVVVAPSATTLTIGRTGGLASFLGSVTAVGEVVTPVVRATASDLTLQSSSNMVRLGGGNNVLSLSRTVFSGTPGTKALSFRLSGQDNNLGGEGGNLEIDAGAGAIPGTIFIGAVSTQEIRLAAPVSLTSSLTVQGTTTMLGNVVISPTSLVTTSSGSLNFGPGDSSTVVIRRTQSTASASGGDLKLVASPRSLSNGADGNLLLGDSTMGMVIVDAGSDVEVDSSSGVVRIGTKAPGTSGVLVGAATNTVTIQGALTASANSIFEGNVRIQSRLSTAAGNDLLLHSSSGILHLGDESFAQPIILQRPGTSSTTRSLKIRGQEDLSSASVGGDLFLDGGSGTPNGKVHIGKETSLAVEIGSASTVLGSPITEVSGTLRFVGDAYVDSSPGTALGFGSSISSTEFVVKRTDRTTNGNGGDLRLRGGRGLSGTNGAVYVGDTSFGSPVVNMHGATVQVDASGTLGLGDVSAATVNIGHPGATVTIRGTLEVVNGLQFSGTELRVNTVRSLSGSDLGLQATTGIVTVGDDASVILGRPRHSNSPGQTFTIRGQQGSGSLAGGNLVIDAGTGPSAALEGQLLLGTMHSQNVLIGKVSGGQTSLQSPLLSVAGDISVAGTSRFLANSNVLQYGPATTVDFSLQRTSVSTGNGGDFFLLGAHSLDSSGTGGTVEVRGGDGLVGGNVLIAGGFGSPAGDVTIGRTGTPTVTVVGNAVSVSSTTLVRIGTSGAGNVEIGQAGRTLSVASTSSFASPVSIGGALTVNALITANAGLVSPSALVRAQAGLQTPVISTEPSTDLRITSTNHVVRFGEVGSAFELTRSVVTGSGDATSDFRITGQTHTNTGVGGNLVLDSGLGSSSANGEIRIGTAHDQTVRVGHAASTTRLQAAQVQVDQQLQVHTLLVSNAATITPNLLLEGNLVNTNHRLTLGFGNSDSFTVRRASNLGGLGGNLRVEAGLGQNAPSGGSIFIGASGKMNPTVTVEAVNFVVDANTVSVQSSASGDILLGTVSSDEIIMSQAGHLTTIRGEVRIEENLVVLGSINSSGATITTGDVKVDSLGSNTGDLVFVPDNGIAEIRFSGDVTLRREAIPSGTASEFAVLGQVNADGAGGNLVLDAGSGSTVDGDISIGSQFSSTITLGRPGAGTSIVAASASTTVQGSLLVEGQSQFDDPVTMLSTLSLSGNLLSPTSNLVVGTSSTTEFLLNTASRDIVSGSAGPHLRIATGAGGTGQPAGSLYLGQGTSPITPLVQVAGQQLVVSVDAITMNAENVAGIISLGRSTGHRVEVSKAGKVTQIYGSLQVNENVEFITQLTVPLVRSTGSKLTIQPGSNRLELSGALNDMLVTVAATTGGNSGRPLIIQGQESPISTGGNLVLRGGNNVDGLALDGSILIGRESTSSIQIGDTGVAVSVFSSQLVVDAPVQFHSDKPITATSNRLEVGQANADFLVLHAPKTGSSSVTLSVRGASVDTGGGVFVGGTLQLDGGFGTAMRGPVVIRGGPLTGTFGDTVTMTATNKMTLSSATNAVEIQSAQNMILGVTSPASQVRIGISTGTVSIGAAGSSTTVNSALTVVGATNLSTLSVSGIATVVDRIVTSRIVSASPARLIINPVGPLRLHPSDPGDAATIEVGDEFSGDITFRKFQGQDGTFSSDLYFEGQSIRGGFGGDMWLDAGQDIDTPSIPTDSMAATLLNGNIFIGTRMMRRLTIGKPYSDVLIKSDNTELEGNFKIPSASYFDTTGGNELMLQSDVASPFLVRRPDGSGSDLTIRAGSSNNPNEHGDLVLGDLSLNKDVMLLSKEITSVDSSQVVNIGTTNAQTVNIGSATTAVVIASSGTNFFSDDNMSFDADGVVSIGGGSASNVILGRPGAATTDIRGTIVTITGVQEVQTTAPVIGVGATLGGAITLGTDTSATTEIAMNSDTYVIAAGSSFSLQAPSLRLLDGATAEDIVVGRQEIGGNAGVEMSLLAQELMIESTASLEADASSIFIGTKSAITANIFVGHDTLVQAEVRSVDVSVVVQNVLTANAAAATRINDVSGANLQLGRPAMNTLLAQGGSITAEAGTTLELQGPGILLGTTTSTSIAIGGALTTSLTQQADSVEVDGRSTMRVDAPDLKIGTTASSPTVINVGQATLPTLTLTSLAFTATMGNTISMDSGGTISLGVGNANTLTMGRVAPGTTAVLQSRSLTLGLGNSLTASATTMNLGTTLATTINMGSTGVTTDVNLRSSTLTATLGGSLVVNADVALQLGTATGVANAISIGNTATTSVTLRGVAWDVLFSGLVSLDTDGNLDLGRAAADAIRMGHSAADFILAGDSLVADFGTSWEVDGGVVNLGASGSKTGTVTVGTSGRQLRLFSSNAQLTAATLLTLEGGDVSLGQTATGTITIGAQTTGLGLTASADTVTLFADSAMALDMGSLVVGGTRANTITMGSELHTSTATYAADAMTIRGASTLVLRSLSTSIGVDPAGSVITIGGPSSQVTIRGNTFDMAASGSVLLDAGATLNLGTGAPSVVLGSTATTSNLNLASENVQVLASDGTTSGVLTLNAIQTINIGRSLTPAINMGSSVTPIVMDALSLSVESAGDIDVDAGGDIRIGTSNADNVIIGGGGSTQVQLAGNTLSFDATTSVLVATGTPLLRLGEELATSEASLRSGTVDVQGRTILTLGTLNTPQIGIGSSSSTTAITLSAANAITLSTAGLTSTLTLDSASGISIGASAGTISMGQAGTSVLTVLGQSASVTTDGALSMDSTTGTVSVAGTSASTLQLGWKTGAAGSTSLLYGDTITLDARGTASLLGTIVNVGTSGTALTLGAAGNSVITVRGLSLDAQLTTSAGLQGATMNVGTLVGNTGAVAVGHSGRPVSVSGNALTVSGSTSLTATASTITIGNAASVSSVTLGRFAGAGSTTVVQGSSLSLRGFNSLTLDSPSNAVTLAPTASTLVIGEVAGTDITVGFDELTISGGSFMYLDSSVMAMGTVDATAITLGRSAAGVSLTLQGDTALVQADSSVVLQSDLVVVGRAALNVEIGETSVTQLTTIFSNEVHITPMGARLGVGVAPSAGASVEGSGAIRAAAGTGNTAGFSFSGFPTWGLFKAAGPDRLQLLVAGTNIIEARTSQVTIAPNLVLTSGSMFLGAATSASFVGTGTTLGIDPTGYFDAVVFGSTAMTVDLDTLSVGIGAAVVADKTLAVAGGVVANAGLPVAVASDPANNVGYTFSTAANSGLFFDGGSVQTAVGGEIRMNVGANTDDALLLDNTLGLHERATAPGVAAADPYGRIWYDTNGVLMFTTGAGVSEAIALDTPSDARLKQSLQPLKNVLNRVVQLQGYQYEWNDMAKGLKIPKTRHTVELGFLAQDVQALFPEVVGEIQVSNPILPEEQSGPFLTVDYGRLTAVLVEGIKELDAQNQALQRRNQELVERMDVLEKQNQHILQLVEKLLKQH